MKKAESQFLRLVKMARQAPSEPVAPMSSCLQTRVLAHWQSASPQVEMLGSVHALFRGALVCAMALMLASIVWSYAANDTQPDDDLALANLELSADVFQ